MVNDIEYRYGDNGRNRLTIHLVVCQESWKEVDRKGTVVQRCGTWPWLSDLRCNLGGRRRWSIEEGLLVEKQQGCNYELCYAENWNVMRGYHYLMRIGHPLDVLAWFCSRLVRAFKERGPQGFIAWVSATLQLRLLFPAHRFPSRTSPGS